MSSRPARVLFVFALTVLVATSCSRKPDAPSIPRTAEGRPDLSGVWQVRNAANAGLEDHVARHGRPAGRTVVEGGTIPYLPDAAKKRAELVANQPMTDPLEKCYMPGVPRIMYLDYPFQIFQTPSHIAMTFEWSQVHRTIYTNGVPGPDGIDFWMGDSRGRWEGDTLVVEVKDQNDRTWLDATGTHHTDKIHVVERYTLVDPNTIRYEATIEDPGVFSKRWKISMPIYRHTDRDRVLEYQCQAELEEANGDFERDPRTWYPGPDAPPVEIPAAWASMSAPPTFPRPAPAKPPATTPSPIKRMPDGKPDLQGYF